MFETASDIIRALVRYPEIFDPKTTSLIILSGRHDPYAEPFRSGFIGRFDERAELIRRLRMLRERERRLLVLWYAHQWKVGRIARHLKISRQHCYRLRDQAFDFLLSLGPREDEAAVTD